MPLCLEVDLVYSITFLPPFILQNGVLLRTMLDTVTGDLSDTRTRYLGSRAVKLFRITMQGSEAVSSQWLFLSVS